MSDALDVLVYCERPEVRSELLAAARTLVDGAGGRVLSVILTADAADDPKQDIARGADEVLVAAPPVDDSADGEVIAGVLADAVGALGPATVLIGSTRTGLELTARLGQRLGVASVTECLALEHQADDGALVVERSVYGGRFISRQALRATPQLAAVQAKRFEPLEPDQAREGSVRELPVQAGEAHVVRVSVRERERSQADIGKAEVIVTAGRGVRTQADLAVLEPLARALGGELAGSRPLVEMAWFPIDRQVGLSGRTVRPSLYIACGVSGQIEHIAGMRSARTVVAINNNAEAPIHGEADYSVVGDLYEIVPALVKEIQDARQGSAAGG